MSKNEIALTKVRRETLLKFRNGGCYWGLI